MEVIFSQKLIEENISKVASQVNNYYSSLHLKDKVVTIPILKGGLFFYTDLVRKLTFSLETGIISTSHYPNGKEIRELEIKFIDAPIKNRHILLVDEICYTGHTLLYLQTKLLEDGAADVRTVVLVNQPKEHEHIIHIPDWSVINYEGKEWLFGYGMDLDGEYRNTMDIYK